MTPVHQLGVSDILILGVGLWLVSKIARRFFNRNAQGTKLNGPPRDSWFFGVSRQIAKSTDSGLIFQDWAAKYGSVFQTPIAFGGRRTVLCDPKAVNHFYSMERTIYVKSKLGRAVISNLVWQSGFQIQFLVDSSCQFGRGLLLAEGESHKR